MVIDKKANKEKKVIILNKKEAIKSVLEGTQFYAYAWNKLYRKELFKDNRYLDGKTFEDAFPVYNVEKYLKKCVDSILGQTFTDFELLLIDDGSTDNSGSICDELAKTDNRIKVIHKENGGLSDARNIGIEVAKGDFIGFIDSDDYIDEDMYAFLYNNILKYDAELSMCGIYDVHKNKEIKKLTPFSQLVTKSEAIELVLDGKLVVANAVSKLYKKELFENVRYPKGKIAEDAAVFLRTYFY
ncbi:hypothetical protein EfmJHP80_09010 [Enterococcus faecium]|nr:hypothetical protein EfmJHP80_09010 [Enterococcus faecium]